MEVEGSFKDLIIPKIKKATLSLTNKKHPHVLLCDFDAIQKKKMGDNFLFFNKTYKNVSYFFHFNNSIFNKETIRIFQ